MGYFRRRWYIIGFGLAIAGTAALAIWHRHLSDFRVLLSVSLLTLFLHQFEEYQFPGYFPRMVNTAMFKSKRPDRYPLNANTAWIINVQFGWLLYALAIVFAEKAVWLATATIMVSAGNVLAHAVLFNVRGKTRYNPGMLTALLLFLPTTIYYFIFVAQHGLVHTDTLVAGIVLGILINYIGVFKPITWLSNKNTPYVFRPLH